MVAMKAPSVAKAILAGKASYDGGPVLVDAADTARLIRAMIADAMPGTKAWVRTSRFSMGSSVDVWVAGDTDKVKDLVAPLGGKDFDGMIDMTFSHYAYLTPHGTVTYGGTRGTAGSRGSVPAVAVDAPVGATKVSFLPWITVNEGTPYGAAK